MKIIRTVLTPLIAFAGFGYSQPKPAPLPESEVPGKILTHFKENFTNASAKWSKDATSYQVEYEPKDKRGQVKISLLIGYDSKTQVPEFMQNAVFNPNLKADSDLLNMIIDAKARAGILSDMKKRKDNEDTFGKFYFLLRSFKAEGETYVLRLSDGDDFVEVTYNSTGKALKEGRKKAQ